jgi:hypothetical protein
MIETTHKQTKLIRISQRNHNYFKILKQLSNLTADQVIEYLIEFRADVAITSLSQSQANHPDEPLPDTSVSAADAKGMSDLHINKEV